MTDIAVILERPGQLVLGPVRLTDPGPEDAVVAVDWTGISTGTERLLWDGRMPDFPGMGYPLVPGYEAVGRVVDARPHSGLTVGQTVFVPGSRGFADVRGLFGAAASRVVVPGRRAIPVDPTLGDRAVLLALAATAHHAVAGGALPDLVVGHGVLGRLIARITLALGGQPTVWETQDVRRSGAEGYDVVSPEADKRRDYALACDASGDGGIIDALVPRMARGGVIVLAGFYEARLGFAFPPAFMREITLRIAAEFLPGDLAAVTDLIGAGRLSLEGLITHRAPTREAANAYRTAFGDATCLKMVLDWRRDA